VSTPLPIVVERLPPERLSLRIAVVTETYPPDINGVAHTLSQVVEGLRARGHELLLIRPRIERGQLPVTAAGFEEFLVRGAPLPMYKQLRLGLPAKGELQKLWARRRPDVVHIATEGPLGWSALRAARKLKIPTTSDFRTNFHAYSHFYRVGWLKGAIVAYMRKFHNGTLTTMVPTPALQAELSAMGFQRLRAVPRGVNTETFSPAHRDHALRASWGADDETVVVLYLGRLAAEKNLGLVLRSYQSMQAIHQKVQLVLVGDGPLHQALRQACPEAVFAGFQTGDALSRHCASADLMLFASLTETFGNVVLEAMASGLGVVAFQHAAAALLINHGVNGWLAKPADEAGFIACALTACQDAEARRTARSQARTTALAHNWQKVVQETESVLMAAASDGLHGPSE